MPNANDSSISRAPELPQDAAIDPNNSRAPYITPINPTLVHSTYSSAPLSAAFLSSAPLSAAFLSSAPPSAAFLDATQNAAIVKKTNDDSGNTALHKAVLANNLEELALLLNGDADINAKNMNGVTALTLASRKNNTAMVNLLLEKQANTTIDISNRKLISAQQNLTLDINDEVWAVVNSFVKNRAESQETSLTYKIRPQQLQSYYVSLGKSKPLQFHHSFFVVTGSGNKAIIGAVARGKRYYKTTPGEKFAKPVAEGILGKGGYGVVKVIQTQNGRKFALKKEILSSHREKQMMEEESIMTELGILHAVHNERRSTQPTDGTTQIVRYTLTTLHQGIQVRNLVNKDLNNSPIQRLQIAYNIAKGIKNLHDQGIIHCDIKTDNLIVNTKTNEVAVIDFGFSRRLKGHRTLNSTRAGNKPANAFVAPEITQINGQVSKASDIYGLGETLRTLLQGKNYYYPIFEYTMMMDPERRPNIQEILKKISTYIMDVAMKQNDVNTIQSLLVQGFFDVNTKNIDGQTALHLAAKNGNIEAVQLLLAKNADINLKDKHNRTALHFAAENGRAGIMKLLLEKFGNVDVKNAYGGTALHVAVYNGNTEAVQLLLAKNAEINIKGKRDWTVLHFAVKNGDIGIAKLLLSQGININTKNTSGDTALNIAARQGNIEMVKLLITYKDNLHFNNHGEKEAFRIAIAKGPKAVMFFASKRAVVYGQGMLIDRLKKFAELESNSGMKVDLQRVAAAAKGICYGESHLRAYYAMNGDENFFNQITSIICSWDIERNDNTTLTKELSQEYILKDKDGVIEKITLKNLLMYYANTLLLQTTFIREDIPFLVTSNTKHAKEQQEQRDNRVYMSQNQEGLFPAIFDMIKSKRRQRERIEEKFRFASIATSSEWEQTLGTLIDSFANTNKPVTVILGGHNHEILLTIKKNQLVLFDPNGFKVLGDISRTKHFGKTPIGIKQLVTSLKNQLLQNDQVLLVLNIVINDQVTLDYNARIKGLHKKLANITSKGAKSSFAREGVVANNHNALTFASHRNDINSIKFFIAEEGIDVNLKNKDDCTALHVAAHHGHTEIMTLLLAENVDVNSKDNHGQTALYLAVKNKNTEAVKLLLAKNADVNLKDADGRTALHIAVSCKNTTIIKLLLEKRSNVNVKDASGWTALHFAVSKGNIEIAKLLLSQGINVNAKDNRGNTALSLAKITGVSKSIILLLTESQAKARAQKRTAFSQKSGAKKPVLTLYTKRKATRKAKRKAMQNTVQSPSIPKPKSWNAPSA